MLLSGKITTVLRKVHIKLHEEIRGMKTEIALIYNLKNHVHS